MSSRNKVTAAALAVCSVGLLADAGLAQCTKSIFLVPDLDQRRAAAGGIPGLPNNGNMYCVPASILNWFAYFANRGLPQPSGLNGPKNWQSNAHYNLVTTHLTIMGALTSPWNGTTGVAGQLAAMTYASNFASSKVMVLQHWCGGPGGCPGPANICKWMKLGGFVSACYGFYESVPFLGSTLYARVGGHCVTINKASTADSTIKFRDPASDAANTTQSPFLSHSVTASWVTGYFSPVLSGRYKLNYGSGLKFLDGWYVLLPLFALTPSNLEASSIQIIRPFRINGSDLPELQNFSIPTGAGAVRAIRTHPASIERVFYTTAPTVPGAPTSRLYELDPSTGASTLLLSGNDLRHLEVNRFGEVYVCDGATLKALDVSVSPPALLGSVTLPSPPRAVAYDDATDTLALITPSALAPSSFARYARNLGPVQSSVFLPAGTSPAGALSLAFAADGSIFLCGDGSPWFVELSQSAAPPHALTLVQRTDLPPGEHPAGLNVDDAEHVLLTSNGVLREYEPNAAGAYVPSPVSLFAGRPSAPGLCIPRSRTNHDRAIHEGPGYVNIADPEIAPGVLDCYADCTDDAVLSVADFTCFQSKFVAGNLDADCNFSGSLTIADFTCFQNAFVAGCP